MMASLSSFISPSCSQYVYLMTKTCLQQTAQFAAVTNKKHSLSVFVHYSKIDSWMNVLNLPVLYQFGLAEVKFVNRICEVVSTTLHIYV